MNTYILFFVFTVPLLINAQNKEINKFNENDNIHGLWMFYDDSNNLIFESKYDDAKPIGVLKYYKDNKVTLEIEYIDSLKNFRWKKYEEDTLSGISIYNDSLKEREFIDDYGNKLNEDERKGISSNYEVMCYYPGGITKLYEYLKNSIKQPEIKKGKTQPSGTSYVGFKIDKKGNVTDVKLVKGFSKPHDDEAIRVISSMPRWNPATQRGYPVIINQTIPIKW